RREDKPSGAAKVISATGGGVPITKEPYYVRGTVQLRTLAAGLATEPNAVVGEEIDLQSGAATRFALYVLEVGYKLQPTLAIFGRVGIMTDFVVDIGEAPVLFRDTTVGARYSWSLPIGLGEDHALTLVHGASLFLPTSRVSTRQDLIMAPDLVTRARLPIWQGLYASADAQLQYRWHKYAERAGTYGGMNTQLVLAAGLGVGYTLEAGTVGTFDLGAGLRVDAFKKYASSEEFGSDTSDQVFWNNGLGWDVSLFYAPFPSLSFVASLEQGANILRDGIAAWRPQREDTELVFTMILQY
ncbi:hypothetical protein L6R52_43670, partial [Myxococcota bacterium]|nr:hypothetical protein [Myxococcota bacterium]